MYWMDANQLGRRNLSLDAFKLALGRRYNRTKKARGGTGANQHKQKGQIDLSATNTAANLAAEHSALRLVEVPASASSVHATGFERIGWHLVPTTGRNARGSLPVRQRRRSCRQCKRQAAGRAGSWVP